MFFIPALVAGLAGVGPVAAQIPNTGQATSYEPGLGACGITNGADDLVVAVSSAFFEEAVCGKSLTAYYQGRSVTANVIDKCMGCADGDLALSPAAFSQLADLSAGRISVSWEFN